MPANVTDYSNIRARDLMHEAIALKPTMSLAQARDLLVEHHISGAPVVGDDGVLVGVFSQTDFVRVLFSIEVGDGLEEVGLLGLSLESNADRYQAVAQRLQKTSVADVMSQAVFAVRPDERIFRVAQIMRKNHIHRVFVTEHGKLAGIISAFDLLALLDGE